MSMNGIGNRDELRNALLRPRPLTIEKVYVPELDMTFGVRVMSGAERDAFETEVWNMKDKRTENLRARLVVRCVCDMEGQLLFDPAEVASIGANSWIALDRLAAVAQRLNAMSDGAMEDLKGKSQPNLGDAQSSV